MIQFEFNNQLMPQSLIEVEELGQFALEAWNSGGYYYYLIIRTILGTSVVTTCGPVVPDIDILPSGFKITLEKMPYKEDKLIKTISYFLNDKSKSLTDARELSFEEAIEQFREIKPYLLSFSEETF